MKQLEHSLHVPVLMKEAIDALELKEGMTVVDATLGGGGYTREIYQRIQPGGTVIAIDRDKSAIDRFQNTDPEIAKEIILVHSNYSDLRKILKDNDVETVDAIVADLGISSDHVEETNRGFSFRHDGPLDMRMDQNNGQTAAELVARISERDLMMLLQEYGDERHARRIAHAICVARDEKMIMTTGELSSIIENALPVRAHHQKIHPATRTFQALRIAVNEEYDHLRIFLTSAIDVLTAFGRLAVVSFHSGEDRIVKTVFRANARGCICPKELPICQCDHEPLVRLVTKKGCVPTEEEIAHNPRARSARMRDVEKLLF